MSDNNGDDHSDSDSSSSDAPNWKLLKETLGVDALKALEEHMANDDDEEPPATAEVMPAEASSTSDIKLPKNNLEYGKKEYWNDRFAEEDYYDWLVGYEDVRDLIAPYMTESAKILLVGCGNSNFSAELYDAGFRNLTNIDYSEVVIDAMKKKYEDSRPGMKWLVMDMTDMSAFKDANFDVVIDKAAMDALMTREGDVWNPNQTVVDEARSMCEHIARILQPNTGAHLHISFAQPHFRKKYLLGWHPPSEQTAKEEVLEAKDEGYSEEFGWTYRVETIAGDANDGCYHHFLYIMSKEKR